MDTHDSCTMEERLLHDFNKCREYVKDSRWEELKSFLMETKSYEATYATSLAKFKDDKKNTLLCYVARKAGTYEIVKILLDMGAEVDGACAIEELLLTVALIDNPHGVSTLRQFILLLEAGLDPNQDAIAEGDLPLLHYLIKENKVEFVRELLRFGADPAKLSRSSKQTAFDVANSYGRDWLIEMVRG